MKGEDERIGGGGEGTTRAVRFPVFGSVTGVQRTTTAWHHGLDFIVGSGVGTQTQPVRSVCQLFLALAIPRHVTSVASAQLAGYGTTVIAITGARYLRS